MAIPFYNQVDQDIYESGDHFIPQQRYRLNYTPSTMLASTVGNTGGVTGTEAAYPYIWPPQGGGGGGAGGGGFANTNKYGLNLDTMKTIDMGKYVEKGGPANMYGGDYVKTSRNIAKDSLGNWKDVDTNQNVYHGNFQNFPSILEAGLQMVGLRKGDPYEGTWTGAEWDDEFDPTVANRNLNTIQRWKAKKEFKAAQEKAAADKAAADQAAAHTRAQGRYDASVASGRTGGHWYGGSDYKGGASGDVTQAGPGRDPDDRMAQGGRIGYKERGFVDPEEVEDLNIFEFMQDQGIPYDQMAEGVNQLYPSDDRGAIDLNKEQMAIISDLNAKGMDISLISTISGAAEDAVGRFIRLLNAKAQGGSVGYFNGGLASIV